MSTAPPLPTVYETLAGLVKFIGVSRVSPEFYGRHWNAIEFACAFLRIVANEYPAMEAAFKKVLPASVRDGAPVIAAAITQIDFTEKQLQWFDIQSTEALKVLVPVLRDPDLPEWLRETRWAILGAFEPQE